MVSLAQSAQVDAACYQKTVTARRSVSVKGTNKQCTLHSLSILWSSFATCTTTIRLQGEGRELDSFHPDPQRWKTRPYDRRIASNTKGPVVCFKASVIHDALGARCWQIASTLALLYRGLGRISPMKIRCNHEKYGIRLSRATKNIYLKTGILTLVNVNVISSRFLHRSSKIKAKNQQLNGYF